MTDKQANLEKAKIAEKDGYILEGFSRWLRAYNWEIEACGRDGTVELQKLREQAPRAIQILAKYLDT